MKRYTEESINAELMNVLNMVRREPVAVLTLKGKQNKAAHKLHEMGWIKSVRAETYIEGVKLKYGVVYWVINKEGL